MQYGSMMEQNQVETTKVASSSSGLTLSGTRSTRELGSMYWRTTAPRARAWPLMASTTRGSSSGSVNSSTRSPARKAKVRVKLSSAWKNSRVSVMCGASGSGRPW